MKFRAVSMAKESLIVLWPSKHVCLKSKELLGEMITNTICTTLMFPHIVFTKNTAPFLFLQYANNRNKDLFWPKLDVLRLQTSR